MDDAFAEGFGAGTWDETTDQQVITSFRKLWDTIYAKKTKYSWDSNPWVWVIYFRRLTKPEGE